MTNLIDRANIYFDTFSNKDLDGLKQMFVDDVTLRDWDINVSGIDNVLEANSNIFNSVQTIKVNPIDLYRDGNVVIAEIEILINEDERILVTDILEYDENNKIKSIRAYKG